MNLTSELLSIWHECLIDHHKNRDCFFTISNVFCSYRDPILIVRHDGYLYDWAEEVTSLGEAVDVLNKKLAKQIREECMSYIDQKSIPSEDREYSDKQIARMESNLRKLYSLEGIDQCLNG